MKTREAVIVAYGRSACCRARKGSFANMHPVDYAAQTLRGVLDKLPALKPEQIDDVIVGCAMPVNEMDYNAGRVIARRAGLPNSVAGQTINRFCSSGLQAIANAVSTIEAGFADCIVAGGTESMSKCFAPHYPEQYRNTWLEAYDEGTYMPMGETAERVADKYGVTRERMDQMAVESHARAHRAQREGKLAPSIVPVINDAGQVITEDEGIRPNTTLETLSTLKPCFRPDGRVTAGTSSQTTDAAAFVVVMSVELAQTLDIKPVARLAGFSVAGCEASMMGLGPIDAVPKVMARSGLTINDMAAIELNEAFAAQALVCIDQLGLPPERVNPYGGAMALGHPMGATGAFLTCKLLDYLKDNDGTYGLVTMCIGGGMGAAGVFEHLK